MMEKDMGAISGSREPDPASGPGPTGFDPARIEAACRALDAVMDEPIDEWDRHVRKCVMTVAEALL
jgi:hypothetical protein